MASMFYFSFDLTILLQLNEGGDSVSEAAPSVDDESGDETRNTVVTPEVKPKKKLKKKRKKQQQLVEADDVDFDDEFFTDSPAHEQTPIKKQQTVLSKCVLSLEQKNLNPDNELKKIFGSKVVQAGQKKKCRGRAHVKTSWLMNPKDNWTQIRKTG